MSSRPYGKIPRKGYKAQPPPSAEIRINIAGRHTLEQFSHELQKAVARMQEHGVYGVQRIRLALETTDEKGEVMAVFNDDGQQVQLIQIPDVPPPPAYRKD